MNEIGSEFPFTLLENRQNFVTLDKVKDYTFTFSGRTSIETVIKNEPQIKKVMLPSYCCDSMIEPFRKNEIEVYFYEVNYDEGLSINLEIQDNIDAILWCNYFGYKTPMPDLTKFVDAGGIIIEDITHSFLSKEKFHSQSQYLIASIRKWEPVLCGGYCASTRDKLKYKPVKAPSKYFLEKKKHAMISKSAFLNGNTSINKDFFLQEFSDSNKWLSEHYSELAIDSESMWILNHVDWQKEYEIRRTNAKILYTGLKKIDFIHPLFAEKEMECPLFVPIIIMDNKRDIIRKKLIEEQIYCPVHWPRPKAECRSNIYNLELSLICDQRYNESDMYRLISVICDCNSE